MNLILQDKTEIIVNLLKKIEVLQQELEVAKEKLGPSGYKLVKELIELRKLKNE